ncbi:MAG: nucleoside 2-deoxyribosyltransferase [Clostridia bacterium]|nr:nucleoside 2-deoxyribosyltransferase [Clostridia bacterium]
MKKIYIAAPFFNDKETDILLKVEKVLDAKGLDVFSPRQHQFEKDNAEKSEWSLKTFTSDKNAIDGCDIVVMLYHGNYSDSGTAWECGYAYATNKPVIVLQLGESSNLMVHEGSHANLSNLEELDNYDFEKMPKIRFSGKMF